MPKVIKKREAKSGEPAENLMETVDDIKEKIQSQRKILAIVFIVALFAIIAAAGIYMYNNSRNEKAENLKMEAYKAFNIAASQPDRASENYKKALDLFRESYEVKEKPDALLLIAYCQYALGNYDDSIATLKSLIQKRRDPAIMPMAHFKLSEAYLKKGDKENALAALNNLEALNVGFKDMALMQIARIYESQGKISEAKTKYNELVTKYPNSALAKEAKAKAEQK